MSEFDPIRALREEISGLADVHKIVQARARASEAAMAEAEAEHDSSLKLDAFMTGLLKEMRTKLRALEDEDHRKATQ
jgi:hypothetical protein